MKININLMLKSSNFGRSINLLTENDDMLNILPTDKKILIILKDGEKSTAELSKILSLGIRGIRRHLNDLENINLVKRRFGKAKNRSFRYSDFGH